MIRFKNAGKILKYTLMDFTVPLLAIFAHPDDESFGMAGTLALFAKHGAEITILALTRGERGSSHLSRSMSVQELGEVRERELCDAASILGVRRVRVRGYPDCGLGDVVQEELVGVVNDVIRDVEPHTLMTFDAEGISGHRDHVVVSRVTTDAFCRTRTLSGGPKDLYRRAIPASAMQKLHPMFTGRRKAGVYEIDNLQGVPDEDLVAIDVTSVRETCRAAARVHKSQNVPDFDALGKQFGIEHFADVEHFFQYRDHARP